MKTREEYTCPLELTHDIMRGKWKPIILWQLGYGIFSDGARRTYAGCHSSDAGNWPRTDQQALTRKKL